MKVHLIGICGTGMGSLAGLLKAAGHDVRGSDEHVYPPMSVQLEDQKIPCFEGFRPANLDWGPDAIVVGFDVAQWDADGRLSLVLGFAAISYVAALRASRW